VSFDYKRSKTERRPTGMDVTDELMRIAAGERLSDRCESLDVGCSIPVGRRSLVGRTTVNGPCKSLAAA
jgi:hypothetical protein